VKAKQTVLRGTAPIRDFVSQMHVRDVPSQGRRRGGGGGIDKRSRGRPRSPTTSRNRRPLHNPGGRRLARRRWRELTFQRQKTAHSSRACGEKPPRIGPIAETTTPPPTPARPPPPPPPSPRRSSLFFFSFHVPSFFRARVACTGGTHYRGARVAVPSPPRTTNDNTTMGYGFASFPNGAATTTNAIIIIIII